MWRLLSRLLNALTFGNFNETLCARLARKRAACRFCRCVCRVLEFVPTFGPGHCDDELEMYEMSIPITKTEPKYPTTKGLWKSFQNRMGIQGDDIPGEQTYGQVREIEMAYWRLYDQMNQEDHAAPFILAALAGALAGFLLGMAL